VREVAVLTGLTALTAHAWRAAQLEVMQTSILYILAMPGSGLTDLRLEQFQTLALQLQLQLQQLVRAQTPDAPQGAKRGSWHYHRLVVVHTICMQMQTVKRFLMVLLLALFIALVNAPLGTLQTSKQAAALRVGCPPGCRTAWCP